MTPGSYIAFLYVTGCSAGVTFVLYSINKGRKPGRKKVVFRRSYGLETDRESGKRTAVSRKEDEGRQRFVTRKKG